MLYTCLAPLRTISKLSLLALMGILTTCSFAQAQVEPWSIELPISAIDPVAGTITAAGTTIHIPPALEIGNSNGITGATLGSLLDSAAPGRVRSILPSLPGDPISYSGATLKGTGVHDPSGNMVAVDVIIEHSENVTVGLIQSVDVANGTFVVNGITCMMNPDERFGSSVLSIGFEPLQFADLARGVGTLAGVKGYLHKDVLYAETVETELTPPPAPGAGDNVQISRAELRTRNRDLRVLGVVSPFIADTTITLTNADTGSVIDTAPSELNPLTGAGEFRVRIRGVSGITRVTATSSNGGSQTANLNLR